MTRLVLLLLALLAAVPAQAEWREASSEHFVIYSEEHEDVLRKFAARLERYDAAMRVVRGIPKRSLGPSGRVTVYVLRDLKKVQRLAGAPGSMIAGFYIPRAEGSVAFIPSRIGRGAYELEPETVLLHEYAHHFLSQHYSAAYPMWFIEGAAEFNAGAEFHGDGSVSLGHPPLHRGYFLFAGNPLPLDRLVSRLPAKLTAEQSEAIYGRGWLLTHYLTLEPSRQGQLTRYLELFNAGRSGLEAATAAFGDLRRLERELEAYKKRRRLSVIHVEAKSIEVGPVKVRTLRPGEQVMMELRIVSARGVEDAQAKRLALQARAVAARFPADATVQAMLAEAEYDAGNDAESEAAAARALAVDPRLIDAVAYKARARMNLLIERGGGRDEEWREVRRWLAAANRVDPDDPEPLMLFYDSFRVQKIDPTANAVAGLAHAFAVAPHDRGLRMSYAYQLLSDGNGKEARAALGPVAFDPHADKAGEVASEVIARIDRGRSGEALAYWDAEGEKLEAGGS